MMKPTHDLIGSKTGKWNDELGYVFPIPVYEAVGFQPLVLSISSWWSRCMRIASLTKEANPFQELFFSNSSKRFLSSLGTRIIMSVLINSTPNVYKYRHIYIHFVYNIIH